MQKQEAILSHSIFRNPENGSNHDHQTSSIENQEVTLPWDVQLAGAKARRGTEAAVEDTSNDDEETEEEDLNGETCSDDILAKLGITCRFRFREHSATSDSQLVFVQGSLSLDIETYL